VNRKQASGIQALRLGRLTLHQHHTLVGVVLIPLLIAQFVLLHTRMDIHSAIHVPVVRVMGPS